MPQLQKRLLTATGCCHDAPTIEGLTMAQGRWEDEHRSTSRVSAIAFVYVYVLGRGAIIDCVSISIMSSFIHLATNNSPIQPVAAQTGSQQN